MKAYVCDGKVFVFDEERWITINGRHVLIKNSLSFPQKDNIINMGIESPINRNGVGRPQAVAILGKGLSRKQRELLDKLPQYGSRVILPKASVSMADLSALSAFTGHEFAMFTKGGRRLIVRGNEVKTPIGITEARRLNKLGYRWSGHVHPGITEDDLRASVGDYRILYEFNQKRSAIYNAKGKSLYFEKGGDKR